MGNQVKISTFFQDLAGRPGPVWDHVIVCDKGHPISFRTLGSGVKINRFPNTAAICRKDRLCTNYHAMQKKFGKKIFNFIPKVKTRESSNP